jgi:hypothetical protein
LRAFDSRSNTNYVLCTDQASVNSSKTLSEAGTVATETLAEPFEPRKAPNIPAHSPAPVIHPVVPVLAHYKVDVVPGSSGTNSYSPRNTIEKHGLFATQTINAGTRIIWETPLITLPAPGDQVMDMMDAFDSLEAWEQEKIWSLNPADSSASELLTYMAEQITSKLALIKEIAAIPEDERTQEEQDILSDRFPKIAKASEWFRIAARWHVARYSLIDLPELERSNLPEAAPITGLFIETARLRHSCVPNCYVKYSPDTHLMTVHTMKDIMKGEELTTNTISSVYYHSAEQRAAELKAKFGTTCECEACNPAHYMFKKHEAFRLAIYTRIIDLERFCTQLEIVEHSSVHTDLFLRKSEIPDHDDAPDIEDLNQAEKTVLGLIKNLKDTGCEGPELIRWYNALIDRLMPRVADALENDEERIRWWRIILRHAMECEKLGLKCFGADSDELKKAILRTKKIQELIEKAKGRKKALEESIRKLAIMGKIKSLEKKAEGKGKDKGKAKQAKEKEREEWEIVATTECIEDEQQIKIEAGGLVATLGKYKLVMK